jgi:signal transduction histidine kinase
MLWSLKESSERVTRATDAKRHFIRYIFHEIRVPFNAVTLGIEQLATLVPHVIHMHNMRSFAEVCSLLSEQAEIVRRILNDVLSLQKIEGQSRRTTKTQGETQRTGLGGSAHMIHACSALLGLCCSLFPMSVFFLQRAACIWSTFLSVLSV